MNPGNMKIGAKLLMAIFVCLFWSNMAYAVHPLITDDSGTQGKGKSQIELNSEFGVDSETTEITVKESGYEVAVSVSYGIKENVDIVLGLPYQGFKVTEDGTTVGKENGISDASLELKWRLYEKDGLSIALKPGISFPTGDEEKGLGNGKTGYSLFTIATKEAGPWAFHFNLGYMRNENKFEDRTDLWHASLASELEVQKDLKIVANIGIEKDAASDSDTDPAFILGGLIYSLTDQVNIDAGIKAGLTSTETDYTYLLGLAWSF